MSEEDNVNITVNCMGLSNIDGIVLLISDELLEVAKESSDFFTNLGEKLDKEITNNEE